MPFTNNFSFSFSQWRTFTTCARRWWLEKIAAWKGWENSAPADARHAYRMKQMHSVWTLAGRAVHDIARQAVVEGIDVATALSRYDSRMRSGWREAKAEARRLFSDKPKHRVNLFELFYDGHDINDLSAYAQAAFNRGRDCVEEIFRSKPYQEARAGELVEAEQLRQIPIGGDSPETAVPTWLVLDLAYRFEGLLWLWDWKTGKPTPSDRDQLLLYALYAVDELGAERDQVRLGLYYLSTGSVELHSPSAEELAGMRDRISRAASKLRSKLEDPAINQAPASRFPRTADHSECQRCSMFFACRGHRDLDHPERVISGYE